MSEYRYQLERYRGRSTRYICPQCKRKQSFTRYIDTYNNNEYISDNVGKCNRIDKCGYHYTPKQYYTDNPWKRDTPPREEGSLRPCGYHYTPKQYYTDNPWKRDTPKQYYTDNSWMRDTKRGEDCSFVLFYRENERTNTQPPSLIPEWVAEGSLSRESTHIQWLRTMFGTAQAERIRQLYGVGGTRDGRVVFWQRDTEGQLRTGKVMAYDPVSGRRTKGAGSCDWVHSIMLRQQRLEEPYNLVQCLYGEHLLKREEYASATVAIVESYKTAHVGAILLPEMVWMAVDSLQGLTAERLAPLRGRDVVLYPDEGRGEEIWREKIPSIAREVGFRYTLSTLIALYDTKRLDSSLGRDIADLVVVEEEDCPF